MVFCCDNAVVKDSLDLDADCYFTSRVWIMAAASQTYHPTKILSSSCRNVIMLYVKYVN